MRTLLVLVLALACGLASAEPVQRLFVDSDLSGYPLVTEDWTHAWSHLEGLYGVVTSQTVSAADTFEIFCDNALQVYVPRCRVRFLDTDGTAAPIALVVSASATRDSLGTGLTEFKLDEASGGTISAAWYTGVSGANGTIIARYLIPHNEWFVLPEWLGFNGDFMVGIVLADTAYVNFEAVWTEAE